ncbi:DUF4253 domain-containing protein [Labedaea rhizosphaerae]|uniref:DUF4253 domain-containing protein n=1 Tax=Labedaea rhizosphaerae TaxID=598644 RepID=UPI00105F3016|nr:DUF4253 domain-containing protein [Labedaea rhizosphaerae]
MFRAVPGSLPDEGSPVLAGIALPVGVRVVAAEGDAPTPVAWVSEGLLPPDELTGLVQRLAAVFPETGLWPLHATGLDDGDLSRPWRDGELGGPDPRVLDPRDVLGGDADGTAEGPHRFVGFAQAVPGPDLTADQLEIGAPGGLLLVPVDRPANTLKALGWLGATNADLVGEALSCVLRSWEDRLGATLVSVGFDTLVVQAPRVPAGDQLTRLLGEHYAFCPDNIDQGLQPDDYLAGLAMWTHWSFWWD